MGIVATIATIVLSISFMTFVAFFGRLPAFRRTPIAWIHRAIWVHLPNGVLALDRRVTSGRFTGSLKRFGHYMMNDKHPTVLIFFFLLLSVSQYLSVPTAWPLLTSFQRTTLSVVVFLPYLFLYLATYSDPGTITAGNLAYHLSLYPYDYTLFHPGATCRTCRLPKPARSKHCSVCKRCVARCDHHCIFINNCVGAGNQHWFLLLLLSTAVLTLYGGGLGVSLIAGRIRARNPAWALLPWRATIPSSSSGGDLRMPWRAWLLHWAWGLQDSGGAGLGGVSMLALLTSPLVWGLLAYNLWNVWCGVTTNETLKWSDWQAEMADGYAFRRRMGHSHGRDRAPGIDPRYEAPWTRWPAETEQIVVRTEDGNPPPTELDPDLPGEGPWERVWRLRDVENLYDLGLWDNLVDVFVPGYQFNNGRDVPVAERRGRGRRRKRKARA